MSKLLKNPVALPFFHALAIYHVTPEGLNEQKGIISTTGPPIWDCSARPPVYFNGPDKHVESNFIIRETKHDLDTLINNL